MRPHLSLDVKNVEASAAFYARIFGIAPQKQTADYAKFDLQDPALNFSMQTARDGKVSRVSHLGIEVDSSEAVEKWRQHLQGLGLKTHSEEDVACCYARQDKVWFEDPDGNPWEVFVVHEQLPLTGPTAQQSKSCHPGSGCC